VNNSIQTILELSIKLTAALVVYLIGVLAFPYVYALNVYPTTPPQSSGELVLKSNSGDKKLKVAVIGDSTALGQGTGSQTKSFSYKYADRYLFGKYDQISYINYAVSGNKAVDIIDNQLSKLTALQPDLVFIAIGANDVTGGNDKNIFKSQIETIINFLQKLDAKVIWVSIPDFIISPILLPPLNWFLSSRAGEFNQIIKDNLKQSELIYVDVFDSTRQPFLDEQNKMFSTDKYHPSADGYGLWVEQINKNVPANFL
jgi:lysophospholipase L1-like esterase